jgi:chromosome segregation ATPase
MPPPTRPSFDERRREMSTDRFTEILNYLSAMSRDFGEFRQEFRQFREETNARFERIEQRLDRIEERLDKVELRLDKMEARAEKTELRLDKMELRFERVEREQKLTVQLINSVAGGLFTFRSDIDELQVRVTLLEGKGA